MYILVHTYDLQYMTMRFTCILQAVGEPPLPLASSIFFAVHDVIASARREAGLDLHFRLDSPATSERIRMTGADNLTKVRLRQL